MTANDVTRVLQAMAGGDRAAAAELLPLVYEELRGLAARNMRRAAWADSGRNGARA